ncbi:MAG: pantetheine-phosphate adenylyltransferase [Alphaproteobacteria bacterium]|nr:pantetheine-phosphate adenylyltransferase [Alphaproteobacteria bacterium]
MAGPRIGVYPGTFDPITNGHVDVIRRAVRLFDRLVVGVAINRDKGPLFSVEERVAMVREELQRLGSDINGKVEVRPFETLLMQFAVSCGANAIVRGLRAVSDFEFEFQMAGMNARLDPAVETVFLMAAEGSQFISSKLIKEICRLGGDITPFVPPVALARLTAKFGAPAKR